MREKTSGGGVARQQRLAARCLSPAKRRVLVLTERLLWVSQGSDLLSGRNTVGASKTDRFLLEFFLSVPSPSVIIHSFSCTVGFSKTGLHSQHRGKRCSDLKVLQGRHIEWILTLTGGAAVRKWVYYSKEEAVLWSHIPVCNDNQAERRSAL